MDQNISKKQINQERYSLNEEWYCLDFTKLLLGDVVLTSREHVISKVIRKFSKSDYSHAILFVDNTSYIHSDKNGVHSNNPQRYLFKKSDNILVLRLKDNIKIDINQYFGSFQQIFIPVNLRFA